MKIVSNFVFFPRQNSLLLILMFSDQNSFRPQRRSLVVQLYFKEMIIFPTGLGLVLRSRQGPGDACQEDPRGDHADLPVHLLKGLRLYFSGKNFTLRLICMHFSHLITPPPPPGAGKNDENSMSCSFEFAL